MSELDLKGAVLIAMPGMGDPRFAHSVVLLCDHSDSGAMGLIVNKPVPKLSFDELLEQLEIPASDATRDMPVFFGGPVETGRGFVLHSSDYVSNLRTLDVETGIALTPTLDVLEDIAEGRGPTRAMLMLGYAGWGPGQLESELARNDWLTLDDVKADIIFDKDADAKWALAMRALGIDPALLSSTGGTA